MGIGSVMVVDMHNTAIDMFTPAQACKELQLDESAVCDLVNSGRLPAYDLGGNIRFKVGDVRALTRLLVLS